MDGGGAVGVLEIFANVFDEVGSEIVTTGENVQARAALWWRLRLARR